PAVHITKLLWSTDGTINGATAEAGTLGVVVPAGTGIFWTYDVTNVSQNADKTSNAGLMNTSPIDEKRSAANPSDDVRPVSLSGDTNGNGVLDVGEVWHFTSQGVPGAANVAVPGSHTNTVTVLARCVTTGVPGCAGGTTVADTAANR